MTKLRRNEVIDISANALLSGPLLGPHKWVPKCLDCDNHQSEPWGEKALAHFCDHPKVFKKGSRGLGKRIPASNLRTSPADCPKRKEAFLIAELAIEDKLMKPNRKED